jgi:DNA-binding IclR family transcriptional regulator
MDVLRIVGALSSEAALKILDEAVNRPVRCSDISLRRVISPSTCYKKFRELKALGLIVEGDDGAVCPYTRISVVFEKGTLRVSLEGEESREVVWEVPP